MPVPDFQSLMLPALMALADGSPTPISEVRERIAVAEGFSAEDVREMLPSGRQSVFVNRVSWAVIYMARADLLVRVRRGVYRLTQEGEGLLSRKPSRIDTDLLGRYPDYAEWSQRTNVPSPGAYAALKQNANIAETPEEALDRAARQLSAALEDDVLHRVRNAKPDFLEKAVLTARSGKTRSAWTRSICRRKDTETATLWAKAICVILPVRSTLRARPRACSSPPPASPALHGIM